MGLKEGILSKNIYVRVSAEIYYALDEMCHVELPDGTKIRATEISKLVRELMLKGLALKMQDEAQAEKYREMIKREEEADLE